MAEHFTNLSENFNTTSTNATLILPPYITNNPIVQVVFYTIYISIFLVGISGNFLVCYVVYRNKAMQTVTNFFITNLGISDIMMCVFAVPFTSLYTFLDDWIFGTVLCHALPLIQSVSVYVSTLTLTAIAIDRYFVIVYPFKPRMKVWTCLLIIFCIWIFSISIAIPYAIFMSIIYFPDKRMCVEEWPNNEFRKAFGLGTLVLQYVVPFIAITLCYIQVSSKLNERVKAKPGAKSSKKEEVEIKRKRRTNFMLIAMVAIFACCWLPLNLVNVIADLFDKFGQWSYFALIFIMAHSIAMSSTCYNPLIYAWLNENFRKEFKAVLPCFTALPIHTRQSTTERSCINGTEARQSLIRNNDSRRITVKTENESGSAFYTAYSDKVHLKMSSSDLD